MHSRRTCLLQMLGSMVPLVSLAQEPTKALTLVVGFPAGGSADLGARLLADQLAILLKRTVLVENRAGAGGQVAARYVKSAPTDGSILFFTNGHTIVTVPKTFKQPGFDPIIDLRPVSPFASFELVLAVHPRTRASSLKELIAFFEQNSAERNVAVPAPGSSPEFIVGRLGQLLKASVQPVPYKGAAPAVQDLVGGQVSAAVLPVADVLPYLQSGRVRAVAVTHTTALLPDVPDFTQLGLPELAVSDFLAVYAPAGVSDEVVHRLNQATRKVLAMPEVVQRIRAAAMEPVSGTPTDMLRRYREASAVVQGLIQAVDYKPQ